MGVLDHKQRLGKSLALGTCLFLFKMFSLHHGTKKLEEGKPLFPANHAHKLTILSLFLLNISHEHMHQRYQFYMQTL